MAEVISIIAGILTVLILRILLVSAKRSVPRIRAWISTRRQKRVDEEPENTNNWDHSPLPKPDADVPPVHEVKDDARRTTEPPSASGKQEIPSASRVPTFRVVALGVSGSGKTVFLASMFHALHVPMQGRSYFLETDLRHRVALSAVYGQVADTTQPWPRGTQIGETREYLFDCVSRHEGNRHHILRISYVDYAGETLESDQEEGARALEDLASRIRGAHALLGILDGQRVLEYLRSETAGRRYFHSTIQPMIGAMAEARANCPVQFLITKWDLVRGFGEPSHSSDNARLGLVRNALMENDQLAALVRMYGRERRRVRLIPVSAVGQEFAEVGPSGNVVKLPDGKLKPLNLEVPLSSILPDLFEQVKDSLNESARKEIEDRLRRVRQLRPKEWRAAMGRFLGGPAGLLLRGALAGALGTPHVDAFISPFVAWMAGPFDTKIAAVKHEMSAAERDFGVFQQVRSNVFNEFEYIVRHLEDELPASVLTGW